MIMTIEKIIQFIDNIPLLILIIGALIIGLAPFFPQPHLFEKLRMLFQGTLIKPVDIVDLIMHASFPLLLLFKFIVMLFLSFTEK